MSKPFKACSFKRSARTFVLMVASSTYCPVVSRPSIGEHAETRRAAAMITLGRLHCPVFVMIIGPFWKGFPVTHGKSCAARDAKATRRGAWLALISRGADDP